MDDSLDLDGVVNSAETHIRSGELQAIYVECINTGAWVEYQNDSEVTSIFLKRLAQRFSPITKRNIYAPLPLVEGTFYDENGVLTRGCAWANGALFLREDSYTLYIHLKDVKQYGLPH